MNKSVKEGAYNVPPINTERYGERAGLEGPFRTKAGKVVYYDPKEGAYYDPDSDIYLSYEEWAALNEGTKFTIVYTANNNRVVPMPHKTYESREAAEKIAESVVRGGNYKAYNIVEADGKLPPHLAKFVDDKGDFTPEVKARLGKDGEARLLNPKKKKVDEADNVHGYYLISMSKPDYENPANTDTKYIKVVFTVPSYGEAHPFGLRKQIDDNPSVQTLRKAGYINEKTVAQWKSDLDAELADAQAKLADERAWLPAYEQELKNKVATLSKAKQIMGSQKVLEGSEPVVGISDAKKKDYLKKATDNRLLFRRPSSLTSLHLARAKGETDANDPFMTNDKDGSRDRAKEYAAHNDCKYEKRKAMVKKARADVGESSDEKTKNKTPGPKNKEAAVYEAPKKKGSKMNESYQDEMKKIMGAIDTARAAIPGLKAAGDMERVAEIKEAIAGLIYAVNKAGNTNFYIEKIHGLLGTQLAEAGMPASIVRHKSELAGMSDKDLATKLGGKSEDELRQMAWRHGFGKMSDHYVKRVAKGKGSTVTESDDAERIARHKANLKDAKAELRAATSESEKTHLKSYIQKLEARIAKIKSTPIEEAKTAYNKDAVDKEIKKDKRIGGKEAKAIHGLLKGRTAEKKTVKEDIALDAAGMEQDHEVQMARGQLYHAARDAIRLHQMLKTVSEDNSIEAWVQRKITTAAEYLKTVANYMEYELINDGIDSTVGISADQVSVPMPTPTAAPIGETTAGGIAGVVMPLGGVQKRKRPVKK